MTFSELVQLYFERSSALQWYWTLYVVIVGGLLAFSSLRQRADLLTVVLVTVLFCFFAYKNAGAINDTIAQRSAALQAIQHISPDSADPSVSTVRNLIVPTMESPDPAGVRTFHITSDVLVIMTVWAMELRRVRNRRGEAGTQRTSA